MMVIFLVGLVWMILLRTLNKDYARYHKEDKDPEEDLDLPDDYGWKQVHGFYFFFFVFSVERQLIFKFSHF